MSDITLQVQEAEKKAIEIVENAKNRAEHVLQEGVLKAENFKKMAKEEADRSYAAKIELIEVKILEDNELFQKRLEEKKQNLQSLFSSKKKKLADYLVNSFFDISFS